MATTTPRWPAEHEHGHPNIVLAALALASLMSVMDLFIVNVALHTIGSHLHSSLSDVAPGGLVRVRGGQDREPAAAGLRVRRCRGW